MQKFIEKNLLPVIAVLGGGAVIFYVLGFAIVQSFVSTVDLAGMFVFSDQYYVDAGASFIFEAIRVPLMAPHLFFPYLLLLFFLIPKKQNLIPKNKKEENTGSSGDSDDSYEIELSKKQWSKLSLLLPLMCLTVVYLLWYDWISHTGIYTNIARSRFLSLIYDIQQDSTTRSVLFFTILLPVVLVVSYFLYHCRKVGKSDSYSSFAYRSALIIHIVFLGMIPLSYGTHLYDMTIIPIDEPEIEKMLFGSQKETDGCIDSTQNAWFLGRFDDNYYFFTKRVLDGSDEEKVDINIATLAVKKVEQMNFVVDCGGETDYSLRGQVLGTDKDDMVHEIVTRAVTAKKQRKLIPENF